MSAHLDPSALDADQDHLRYWRIHILDPHAGSLLRCCRGAVRPSEAVAFAFWDMPLRATGHEFVELIHNEAGAKVLVREIPYSLYRRGELAESLQAEEAVFQEVDDLMSLTAGEEGF